MKNLFVFIYMLFSLTVIGQFNLPKIPDFDSTYIREYNGRILAVNYFKDNEKVFEKDFISGGRLDYPFSNGRPEDSCYAFINKNNFDFYFFDSLYIINEKFSYNTNIYSYSKYSRPGLVLIEDGKYLIVKDRTYNIVQGPKYKIGKWTSYANNKPVEVIDYDNYTINGDKIVFSQESKEILNLIKQKSDSLVENTFGKKFARKYIVFNLDKSRFDTDLAYMGPTQPSGVRFLSDTKNNAKCADMCYDIMLNDTLRFDAIVIRIDKDLNIISKQKFKRYGDREYNLCVGLDKSLKKKINLKVSDFKDIAKKNNFNFWDRNFYLKMEWNQENDIFGKLFFVMEEETELEENGTRTVKYYRRLRIDPLSGKCELLEEDKDIYEDFDIGF